MVKALDGINVLEFSSHLGVAYAAMLLAEQGAHAVKVEPPGGDRGRGKPHFHVLNRSKRSVAVDFESAAGRAEARQLIERADVVIVGTISSQLSAQALDFNSLQQINPRVIALYMPPMGSRGGGAELDASEELVSALGGIAGDQWARSGSPVPLTFPASSYSAGILGAAAAGAALLARGTNGPGQAIELSLLAGAFSLQTGAIIRHEKMASLYHGPQDPLGPIPCYRLFEAGDHLYLFVACGNSTFWNKFALALDRPDLVTDPRFENGPWGIPQPHWQELKDILEPIMHQRPRDEWLRLLREADVPCAPVMTRQEFIESAQTDALGMRRELSDPVLGLTVQLGVPVTLNSTPGEIIGPAPVAPAGGIGSALEWFSEQVGKPANAGRHVLPTAPGKGPLTGVRVLDFCSYIAGSYGPMILAQMGADVIKIESLEGDAFRNFGFGFLGWNQGKRGLALNLASLEGHEIIHGLAAQADIVVENLRPGRMNRFGLGYEALAARNPRIIYMSVNGFGNEGPEHNQPGFDPLLQARSGVMAAQGGPHGHPVYLTCAICDYGAAMLSAYGCVLALNARERTGKGQFCATSLLQAAMALQAGEFIFYNGRPDMENGSAEYRGPAALNRVYQCRDGEWLYLHIATSAQWEIQSRMTGLDGDFADAARETSEGKLADALAGHFMTLERSDAIATLRRAGVPIVPVHRFADLFDEPQVTANELLIELKHSEWGLVAQSGILAKFSGTPGIVYRAAPALGEHSAEILETMLGYSPAQIADLRTRKIISYPSNARRD